MNIIDQINTLRENFYLATQYPTSSNNESFRVSGGYYPTRLYLGVQQYRDLCIELRKSCGYLPQDDRLFSGMHVFRVAAEDHLNVA